MGSDASGQPGAFAHDEVTPLMEAIHDGEHEDIRRILDEEGVDPNSFTDGDAYTYLDNAVIADDPMAVSLLLKMNANPHYERFGRNALHMAVSEGKATVASLLLDAGLDPNKPDGNGQTPLQIASERAHVRCVTLLRDNGACGSTSFPAWYDPATFVEDSQQEEEGQACGMFPDLPMYVEQQRDSGVYGDWFKPLMHDRERFKQEALAMQEKAKTLMGDRMDGLRELEMSIRAGF